MLIKFFNHTILRFALKALFRVKVQGLENTHNLPQRLVIIANHTSFLDVLLLAAFLPVEMKFAVDEQIAKQWWMAPLRAAVPLYKLSPLNPFAIRGLMREVEQGQTIMIFPEGRLTKTGMLMKVYDGTAMVALKTEAALLRVRIDGAQYSKFNRLKGVMKQRWLPRITLSILPPMTLAIDPTLRGRAKRQRAGMQLQDVMSDLIFQTTPQNQTLFEALLEARDLCGPQTIAADDIKFDAQTYANLTARALVLGGKLKPYLSTQKTIGVMLPNSVATLITFFAAQAAHGVPAMLNFTSGRENILSACRTAGLTHIISSQAFIEAAKLEALIEALKAAGLKVVRLEDIRASLSMADKLKALLAKRWPTRFYQAQAQEAKRAGVVLFTSGSEGAPKAVVLTHKNILANRAQLAAIIDFNPTDHVLNALPLFHSFGLTGGTLLPLLGGVRQFLYPTPLHYRLIPEMAYDRNATILFGTDTFLSGYARVAHPYDFYRMRYVFAGGEKLQATTAKTWMEKFGIRLLEGYGSTEAAPAISINTPMHYRAGTVGRLLPGMETQLTPAPEVTHNGAPVFRLAVKGPNIMAGYWRAEAPCNLEAPEGGWYDTGDLVQRDAEGFISIVGRAKRFAKIGGEMISLTQVESYAATCWPHTSHAVIAIADERKGQQLVLFTTQADATAHHLRAFMKAQGAPDLAAPRTLKIIDKIPLLATGKVNYPALGAMV